MKNKLICLLLLSCGFIAGCGSTVVTKAEQEYPLKIFKQNRNGQMETWVVKDSDTGVNYIVVGSTYSEHGYDYTSMAMQPRYNKDGTLYID